MALLYSILVLGLLASFSPSTIIVFILLLATKRASVNGAAFLVGWSLSLIVVFVASYALGGTHTASKGSGHAALNVVEVVFGVGLVLLGVREWRRRDRPSEPSPRTKGLEGRLVDLRPIEAATLGVWEQPWTLTAAAAIVVANHHSAVLVAILAFLVFTFVSTATVGLVYAYFHREPGVAEQRLDDLRKWLVSKGPTLLALVSFVVGLYLVADGTWSLLG